MLISLFLLQGFFISAFGDSDHASCMNRIFRCSMFQTLFTEGLFSDSFIESPELFDERCSNQERYIRCIKRAADECKHINAAQEAFIVAREFAIELCKSGDPQGYRDIYLKSAACINKQKSVMNTKCGENSTKRTLNANRLIEHNCRYQKALLKCKRKVIVRHCGPEAGEIFKNVLSLEMNLDILCLTQRQEKYNDPYVIELASSITEMIFSLIGQFFGFLTGTENQDSSKTIVIEEPIEESRTQNPIEANIKKCGNDHCPIGGNPLVELLKGISSYITSDERSFGIKSLIDRLKEESLIEQLNEESLIQAQTEANIEACGSGDCKPNLENLEVIEGSRAPKQIETNSETCGSGCYPQEKLDESLRNHIPSDERSSIFESVIKESRDKNKIDPDVESPLEDSVHSTANQIPSDESFLLEKLIQEGLKNKIDPDVTSLLKNSVFRTAYKISSEERSFLKELVQVGIKNKIIPDVENLEDSVDSTANQMPSDERPLLEKLQEGLKNPIDPDLEIPLEDSVDSILNQLPSDERSLLKKLIQEGIRKSDGKNLIETRGCFPTKEKPWKDNHVHTIQDKLRRFGDFVDLSNDFLPTKLLVIKDNFSFKVFSKVLSVLMPLSPSSGKQQKLALPPLNHEIQSKPIQSEKKTMPMKTLLTIEEMCDEECELVKPDEVYYDDAYEGEYLETETEKDDFYGDAKDEYETAEECSHSRIDTEVDRSGIDTNPYVIALKKLVGRDVTVNYIRVDQANVPLEMRFRIGGSDYAYEAHVNISQKKFRLIPSTESVFPLFSEDADSDRPYPESKVVEGGLRVESHPSQCAESENEILDDSCEITGHSTPLEIFEQVSKISAIYPQQQLTCMPWEAIMANEETGRAKWNVREYYSR